MKAIASRRGRAVFLLLGAGLLALSGLSPAHDQEAAEIAPKKSSFVVLPIIYHTPETGWGGGFGGLVTYRFGASKGKSRPSSMSFVAELTQNKQYTINLKPELYLKKETYILTGNFEIKRYPTSFYGIGNNVPDEMEEEYTFRQTTFEISLQKRLWAKRNVFAGLQYGYHHFDFLKFDPAGQLISGSIFGTRGGTVSSLDFLARLDSRDNIFTPRTGNFFQLALSFHGSFIGSDYHYTKLKLDFRKYFPVLASHVLAVNTVFQASAGPTPFMSLPRLGGENIMRGYYTGRFRDKILAAFQAEYRFPVWWRLGLAAFLGAGDVSDTLGHLRLASFKLSAGWGIRFKVSSQEGATIRLDFGYGKNCSGMYFTANEAF